MAHGEVSQIIDAPAGAVFDLLHNYDRRLEWDTLLSAAYLTDGSSRAELGASTVCVGRISLGRMALKTRYIAFERPRLAAVKLVGRSLLFASWAASIRHVELPHGQSQVAYTWTFQVRPRWLAWLIEPIVQRVFRWETRQRLAALECHFGKCHNSCEQAALR
jgi:hypothetical protein